MTLKRIDTNPIVESVARKNKKFRKYLELKKKGKIIRTQPKLPGMKKGKSVTIKPVGVVFKVETSILFEMDNAFCQSFEGITAWLFVTLAPIVE